jgi:hypothetical protein
MKEHLFDGYLLSKFCKKTDILIPILHDLSFQRNRCFDRRIRMSQDTLAQLHNLDSALLTDVVRQDQRSPTFALLDWSVARLSNKGIINPDGLFRLSGQGRDSAGTRPWSFSTPTWPVCGRVAGRATSTGCG